MAGNVWHRNAGNSGPELWELPFWCTGVKASVSELGGASKSSVWDFTPDPPNHDVCAFKVCTGYSDGLLELGSTLRVSSYSRGRE